MNVSELGMPRTQSWSSSTTLASNQASSKSSPSSKHAGSSIDSDKASDATKERKSSLERIMNKAKSKLGSRSGRVESLPDDDVEFEKQKAKEMSKYRQKAEDERLKLREKTIFGMEGAAGFDSLSRAGNPRMF